MGAWTAVSTALAKSAGAMLQNLATPMSSHAKLPFLILHRFAGRENPKGNKRENPKGAQWKPKGNSKGEPKGSPKGAQRENPDGNCHTLRETGTWEVSVVNLCLWRTKVYAGFIWLWATS